MLNRKYKHLDKPAIVRPATKVLPYHILAIDNILEYKVLKAQQDFDRQIDQAEKWLVIRAEAVKMVEEQVSTLKFSKEEKDEVTVLARKKALKSVIQKMYGVKDEEIPLTKFQQLKQALKKLWNSAFNIKE